MEGQLLVFKTDAETIRKMSQFHAEMREARRQRLREQERAAILIERERVDRIINRKYRTA